jgi:hypothetical protein
MSEVPIKITAFPASNLFMFSNQTVILRMKKPFGKLQTYAILQAG